jgi:hypothetical protein
MNQEQPNNEEKIESHVYVQMPDGEEMNIKKTKAPSDESPEEAMQTAKNTPTKASSEVVDGEAG